MRIVLLNQFFASEPVATAQLSSDLAQCLAREHDVTVICASAASETASWDRQHERTISVLRTRGFRFSHGRMSRLASYISYVAGTIWCGLSQPRADIYLALTTPPVLSVIAFGFALLRGGRHVIWEMDVYPDIAIDIGYFKRGGIIDRVVGVILDWSRRHASAIIVLGEDMKKRLIARGIPDEKIHIAENWADGEEIQPKRLASGPLVIEYLGNLGLAHEIDTVADVIERLRNEPSFQFVFIGGGARRERFEAVCRDNGIQSVSFKPCCDRTEMSQSLGESHLGLVTQLPQTVGSVVPTKFYSIMAAGRPILYIGPEESTPARHIKRFHCGWQIAPGDVTGLENLLIELNRKRHLISEAGERARIAFEQNFDRSIGVDRILQVIEAADHSTERVPKLSPSAAGD